MPNIPNLMIIALFVGFWNQTSFSQDYEKVAHEMTGLVQQLYLDSDASTKEWSQSIQQLEQIIRKSQIKTEAGFEANVNQMLSRIGMSKNSFFHFSNQNYWLSTPPKALQDQEKPFYFGAWFERKGRYWYVQEVFPGTPADEAGLLRGDQIRFVNDEEFQPIIFGQAKSSIKEFKLVYSRDPLEQPRTIVLKPIPLDYRSAFNHLITARSRLMEKNSRKIAYLRLPGLRQELLANFKTELMKHGPSADAIILDLRNGLPGLDSGYLPLFFSEKPSDPLRDKKYIVLVNEGTQEGLEWLAELLRDKKSAVLLGEKTAGHRQESKAFHLKTGPYLVRIPQREPKSEIFSVGLPLEVDIKKQDTLIFARGEDELVDEAIKIASHKD